MCFDLSSSDIPEFYLEFRNGDSANLRAALTMDSETTKMLTTLALDQLHLEIVRICILFYF